MKKTILLFSIVLCLILSLTSLTSCGSKPSDETTATVTETPATTEAPITTEAPATTQAQVTTEAPATTEAPVTTEKPTTTEAPATTEQAECTHIWDEGETTVEATCTKEGEILYTCTLCGKTKKETIPMSEHAWDNGRVIGAADCVHEGSILYTCTVCSKARKTEKTPPTGVHTPDNYYLVVEPTESTPGELEGFCKVCGARVRKTAETTYAEYRASVVECTDRINAFADSAFGGSSHTKMDTSKYDDPLAYPTSGQHPRLLLNGGSVAAVRTFFGDPANSSALKELLNTAKSTASGTVGEYSAGTLNCIRANAFLYQMTGVKLYGYDAIRMMKEFITSFSSMGSSGDPCRKYGEIMFATAITYDWCYDLLTAADKTQLISGVEHRVVSGSNMEVGFPPSGQWATVGHGAERQVLRDYLSMALAIYDEEPTWYEFIGGRFYEEYVPVRNLYYEAGYYPQGISVYLSLRFAADLWSAWLIKSATGTFPYESEENMKQVLHTAYSMIANGSNYFFGEGDKEDRTGAEELGQLAIAGMMSGYLFDDPTAMSWADYASYSYIETPFYMILKSSGVEGKAAQRYDGMDLIVYNGAWLGQMIAHSNWKSNSASVFMKIGNRTTGNHDHSDSGSFQIYYKGILAGDSGYYDKYDSNHCLHYHQATIAHNSIVLQKGSDVIQQKRCGEPKSIGNPSWERDWGNSQYQFGTTTGYAMGYLDEEKTQPKYAYIAGDIAAAYTSLVSRLDRRMLAVYDTGNPDVPMYFFVYDNITASDSSYEKVFLLHTVSEPEIEGNTLTVTSGSGKLVLQNAVGDCTLSKIGGEGRNYEVGGTQIATLNGEKDGYWGRAEIKTVAGKKTDVMLNVMYVCDKSKAPEGQTATAITSSTFKGSVIGNVAAIFIDAAERRTTGLSFTAPGEGDLTYYISGVKAGNWTVVAGGNTQTVTATEEGGLLVFTAAAGRIVLTAPKN